MESLKKLQQVYNSLEVFKKNYAQDEVQKGNIDQMKRLINEFIVDNEKKDKKKKLAVWNCTETDGIRLAMNNVHYNVEENVAVATNGKVLYITHDEYVEPTKKIKKAIIKEGQPVEYEEVFADAYDKYGEPVDARYPNYKAVIPLKENRTPVTFISEEEARKRLDYAKAECKLRGYKGWERKSAVSLEPKDGYGVDFRYQNTLVCATYLQMMLEFGLDDWTIFFRGTSSGEKEALYFIKEKENGDLLLVCSCTYTSEIFSEEMGVAVQEDNF